MSDKYPFVRGLTCPSCGSRESIFLAEGNYLTCSWIECPEPDYADALKARDAAIKLQLISEIEKALPREYRYLADEYQYFNQAIDEVCTILATKRGEIES